jgi:hypothetical protein
VVADAGALDRPVKSGSAEDAAFIMENGTQSTDRGKFDINQN